MWPDKWFLRVPYHTYSFFSMLLQNVKRLFVSIECFLGLFSWLVFVWLVGVGCRLLLILRKVSCARVRFWRVEQMQRIILQGLSGYFKFERPLIEKECCQSDLAVVPAIYELGGVCADAVGRGRLG
jgi:hypothetical protein